MGWMQGSFAVLLISAKVRTWTVLPGRSPGNSHFQTASTRVMDKKLWKTVNFFSFHFSGGGMGLGFELRDSHLHSRCSTTWTTLPVQFSLTILEMGVSQTMGTGWPWTAILLISASQVARITGVTVYCNLNTPLPFQERSLLIFLYEWAAPEVALGKVVTIFVCCGLTGAEHRLWGKTGGALKSIWCHLSFPTLERGIFQCYW
jgi:hypothetical protein